MRAGLRASLLPLIVMLVAVPAIAEASFGAIDTPANNATVAQPFVLSGWAIDFGWPVSHSGVDQVKAYICPVSCNGSNATWLPQPTYGLPRPDIAALFGDSRLTNSGFSLAVSGLAAGQYQIRVSMHSWFFGGWNDTGPITITVLAGQPYMALEAPAPNASVSQPTAVSGWALHTGASSGSGIAQMTSYGFRNPGSGEGASWGNPTMGISRPDIAAIYGPQFGNSGYTVAVSGKPAGEYRIVVYAQSSVTGVWDGRLVTAYIDVTTAMLTIDRLGSGTGAITATGLSCPGGPTTQAVPCAATYSLHTAVTLTAVPDSGSTFTGWGGACSGTGTCNLTMSNLRYVTATFTKGASSYATNYYHTDIIGSVRALTDGSGATVIRHDYSPFGEDPQPLTGDPMRFAGKELDPETALHYFEARYFRNVWGRFTTVDPLSGDVTDPQSFNAYAYARNNPFIYQDPSGMKYAVTIYGDRQVLSDFEFEDFRHNLGPGMFVDDGNEGSIWDRRETVWREIGRFKYIEDEPNLPADDEVDNGGGRSGGGGVCPACNALPPTPPGPTPPPPPPGPKAPGPPPPGGGNETPKPPLGCYVGATVKGVVGLTGVGAVLVLGYEVVSGGLDPGDGIDAGANLYEAVQQSAYDAAGGEAREAHLLGVLARESLTARRKARTLRQLANVRALGAVAARATFMAMGGSLIGWGFDLYGCWAER